MDKTSPRDAAALLALRANSRRYVLEMTACRARCISTKDGHVYWPDGSVTLWTWDGSRGAAILPKEQAQ